MSRKNRNVQQSAENADQDEPRVEAEVEPAGGGSPSDSDQQGGEFETEMGRSSEAEPPASESGPKSADEDPLADVRQSLIAEEAEEHKRKPSWWRRMIKGRAQAESRPEEGPVTPEGPAPLAVDASMRSGDADGTAQESEEYTEQIDELIDMLASEADETPTPESTREVSTPGEPLEATQRVDVEKLKKQAFRPSAPGEEGENFSAVREVALEGDEQVFVEVESKAQDPLQERLKTLENALKPYGRSINIAFAFLGIVMAIIAGLLLYNIYQETQPVETPAEVSNVPYPTSVSLPGGWSFNLGKGTLQNGEWNPQGAEWLEGTEVCRWVALPWSRQLEAVIRTLNPQDPIEVVMSNNDRLIYAVYSVRQLTSQEMFDLDPNTPCLLVVLAEADSDRRWVLTALP